MRAAILTEQGRIESIPIPIPNIDDEEILVRVMAVGICGSDIAVYKGEHPYKKPPVILGHELCGIVENVGKKVKFFVLGDRVCCSSFSHCDQCEYCLSGTPNLCSDKQPLSHLTRHGAFAEYISLKENMAHKVSDEVDFHIGALVEPLAIGLHAVRIALNSNPNKIVILGAGSIGLSCLITAKYLGVKKVLITDRSSLKKDIACKLSADEFINTSDLDPRVVIPNKLGGETDVTIITSSHESSLDEAISITKNGGHIIVVSYFADRIKLNPNTFVRREISIQGSALCSPKDLKDIIEWIETKKIDPSPMITHHISLLEADKAMRLKTSMPGEVGKIVLINH